MRYNNTHNAQQHSTLSDKKQRQQQRPPETTKALKQNGILTADISANAWIHRACSTTFAKQFDRSISLPVPCSHTHTLTWLSRLTNYTKRSLQLQLPIWACLTHPYFVHTVPTPTPPTNIYTAKRRFAGVGAVEPEETAKRHKTADAPEPSQQQTTLEAENVALNVRLADAEAKLAKCSHALQLNTTLRAQLADAGAQTLQALQALQLENEKLHAQLGVLGRLDNLCDPENHHHPTSDAHIKQRLVRFLAEGRDHLGVQPVYLGFTEYKNLRGLVSSIKVRDLILERFRGMTAADYHHHPLREFFLPNITQGGEGYVPKMVRVKAGQTHIMFDVDHVVPKRWGGVDHPRNYVVVHQSMNRSFGEEQPEVKMAYYGRSVLRKVAEFTRSMVGNKAMGAALVHYLQVDMEDW